MKRDIVHIRPIEPRDVDDLYAFYRLPEVAKETSLHPYLTTKQVAALFDAEDRHTLVATLSNFPIEDEAFEDNNSQSESVVGNVTLYMSTKPRQKHVAMVAIAVNPAVHNLGIGKRLMQHALDQADHWLNLVRLELDVYCDNLNAIHLYEKMGFQHEGRKRMGGFKAGHYVDVLTMARIKPGID